MARDHAANDAQASTFETEHWLAWLFAIGAIVLGVLGLLRAFGVFGPANGTATGQGTSISPGGLPDSLWDGGVLLLAALSSGLLAWALHCADHHRMRDLDVVSDRDQGLWKTEHGLAYLFALATIVLTVIGLLTAYNKIGGHHWQPDGIPWLLAGIGTALLANALHAVRHHQLTLETPRLSRTVVRDDVVQERRTEPVTGYRPDSPRPVDEVTKESERTTREPR
jgi:hypothetical protein